MRKLASFSMLLFRGHTRGVAHAQRHCSFIVELKRLHRGVYVDVKCRFIVELRQKF